MVGKWSANKWKQIAVTLKEAELGTCILFGLAEDGSKAVRPRKVGTGDFRRSARGLDLERGWLGGPVPPKALERFCHATTPSACIDIINRGLRPALRHIDRDRQLKHKSDRTPVPGVYGTIRSITAYTYPWNMFENGKGYKLGEHFLADGSRSYAALLEGVRMKYGPLKNGTIDYSSGD